MKYYYLPESLCMIQSFLNIKGETKLAKYHYEKISYLISYLYQKKIFNKSIKNNSEYINLNSDILRSLFGDYYRGIITFLLNEGIVETDKQYIKNSKSKGYRLSQRYQKEGFRQIMQMDTAFSQKLMSLNEFNKNKNLYKRMEYDLNSIEFNTKEAINFICDKFCKNNNVQFGTNVSEYIYFFITKSNPIPELNPESIQPIFKYIDELSMSYNGDDFICSRKEENQFYNADKFLCDLLSITKIHNKDFFFKVDDKGKRVHTNITNLSSSLRQFITINGESIVNIDIKNSQPLLLLILVQNYFKERHKDINSMPDVLKYKELVETGKFYEFFFSGLKDSDRKFAKQQLFICVFFDKIRNTPSSLLKQFIDAFPSIYEVIKFYKKSDHSQLAIKLQQIESDTLIRNVVKGLYNNNKMLNLLTVHDSIICPLSNVEEVKENLLEGFNGKGVYPSIKTEILN